MLTKLKKCLKIEKKNSKIFDIVIYGSFTKGKTEINDIDIVVIFREGSLKERLNEVQRIKRKINLKNLDIKGILWEELFKSEFFARSGIFFEGISLLDGKSFSEKVGFKNSVIFIYNLKNKSHTEKVKFNYLLSGRKGPGIIKKMEGKHLAPGVIQIPINNSFDLENIFKTRQIDFTKQEVLSRI